ncbi:hypothetical protein [Actinomadura craniellae]|uniref:hypothetical protein n=1 Tax=Actinomadura craniellae TaxID=2231787 RepID=UPI0011BE6A82|nr:hypothetical protein [Actinomadura craniellae]
MSVLVRRTVPLALAGALVTALPGRALAEPPPGQWVPAATPALAAPAALHGVTAPNRRAAWVVGSEAGATVPVVLRWNGTAWDRQAVPAGTAPELVDVDARGPANAWAVGQSANPADVRALRWNGRAWRAVPYPLAKPLGVSVDSGGTAWSVGCTESDCAVLQRQGGDWVRHDPGISPSAIAARTPHDVWAGGTGGPLARYDGTAWTPVPLPGQWPHWVLQILPLAANDVWVYTLPFDPLFSGPRVLHWDGTTWTEHQPPPPSSLQQVGALADDPGFLGGIASDGRGGLWLQTNRDTYYHHFDGTTWTRVPRTQPIPTRPTMYGLAQIGNTRSLWAAGHGPTPLIERFR